MPTPHARRAAPGGRNDRRWHRVVHSSSRVRAVIKRRRWLDTLYRVVLTAVGALVVVVGLILVPLPGPGWLIVFFGLAILGTEFHWARRLLVWARMALARFAERWRAWRSRRAALGT